MILLEILKAERAARATDLETHWTTYIAPKEDEFIRDDLDGIDGMITLTAVKQAAGGCYKYRMLAAFPKNSTIVITY